MKHFSLFVLLLSSITAFAQTHLPVIRATSKNVSINDGGFFDKDVWNLSPEIKPDVYTADRTRETKWVTFYTDIDSIRVKVKPGTKVGFIVLLNSKDSCYIQVASAIPSEQELKKMVVKRDTIPFTLTAYNAIMVRTIINNSDTVNLHFDIGASNFRLTRDAILKKTKLLSNQPDALAGKAAPNYNKMNKVFKLQMGNAVWNNPDIGSTKLTAHDMDGRFGWNLFDNKIVEVDYDHQLLIISPDLPRQMTGYVKSKLKFIRNYVCAEGTFEIAGKKYKGDFLMDTGADQAAILDSTWVSEQRFPKNLKAIKSVVASDPRGAKYEIKVVLAPMVKVNSFALPNVPVSLFGSRNPTGMALNFFGNDLLKRFNTVLDFKNDHLYLKPSHLIGVKYREES